MNAVNFRKNIKVKRTSFPRAFVNSKGMTLVELTMGILLITVLASLVGISYYQTPLKHRVDSTIYLSQSIMFSAQNYFQANGEWPGDNRGGNGNTRRCRTALASLENTYIGEVEGPFNVNEWRNPLGQVLMVTCGNSGHTPERLWIKQCVPSEWVGYIVNALPNTRRVSTTACANSDYHRIFTEIPTPGEEPMFSLVEELEHGESMDLRDCPPHLTRSIHLSSPKMCMELGSDEEDASGFLWVPTFNGDRVTLRLQKQYTDVNDVVDPPTRTLTWSNVSSNACEERGIPNRVWVWQLCE